MNKGEKIDNTIKIISKVLEENKDNPKVKDVYEDIKKLEQRRKNKNT